jgi:hypothetical protein
MIMSKIAQTIYINITSDAIMAESDVATANTQTWGLNIVTRLSTNELTSARLLIYRVR